MTKNAKRALKPDHDQERAMEEVIGPTHDVVLVTAVEVEIGAGIGVETVVVTDFNSVL